MKPIRKVVGAMLRGLLVIVCTIAIAPGDTLAYMTSSGSAQAASPQDQTAKIPPDQLDSLVAPIALYPDPMLAQTLSASTYPLELIQLQQWLAKNPGLKDKALADAVSKEPWDPSIQALAGLPEVVKRLADDIQWATDLGNAFLAQQSDVMDAVQRMRKKAQDTGNLKSTEQQKVETRVIESKNIIVVEQANPQVVYVPSYDPVVVYGPPIYPYPPIYYPPAGYYAAGIAISFGVGMMMGANPQHRGGAPYGDRGTANKFGGTARGDSLSNRQASARQQVGRQGGNLPSNRGGAGVSNRASGAGAGNRTGGAGAGNRAGGGGADRVGSRDVSRSGGGNRDAFGGGSRGSSGYNGSSARSSSSRGSSSMGSRGGGGGGSRGGGGGRRR